MVYRLLKDGGVLRAKDNAQIPPDPGNLDYAEFLAWRGAGNVPDPVLVVPDPPFVDVVAELADLRARVASLEQRLPGVPR